MAALSSDRCCSSRSSGCSVWIAREVMGIAIGEVSGKHRAPDWPDHQFTCPQVYVMNRAHAFGKIYFYCRSTVFGSLHSEWGDINNVTVSSRYADIEIEKDALSISGLSQLKCYCLADDRATACPFASAGSGSGLCAASTCRSTAGRRETSAPVTTSLPEPLQPGS